MSKPVVFNKSLLITIENVEHMFKEDIPKEYDSISDCATTPCLGFALASHPEIIRVKFETKEERDHAFEMVVTLIGSEPWDG